MSFSTFLTSLLVPLNLCMVLMVLAVVLFIVRWRKTAVFLLAASLFWGVFWSLPATSLWAGGRLEQRYPAIEPQLLPAAQAIVVLGGHTAGGRKNWFEPYDKTLASTRTDTALKLYEAHRAPLIVLSGAALDGTMSEAEFMATTLKDSGIPADALTVETNSHNTHENAVYSAKILKELNLDRILLVTSALHMPRAVATFKKQGLSVTPAASPPQIVVPDDPRFSFWLPDRRAFDASRSIIKEYAGLLMYWLRGWV